MADISQLANMSEAVAIFAAVVSFGSAIIAVLAWRQQRTTAQLVVNTHFLNDTLSMLAANPSLLELHGITKDSLAEQDLTAAELIYMLNTVYAGQAFHGAGRQRRIILSSYRRQLLENPKFERAWRYFIRERLTLRTPFTDAIDRHYDISSL